MSDMTLEQEILDVVRRLDSDRQREALAYPRDLEQLKGEPGWQIIEHAREIAFPVEDLREMAEAIEDWCERIDDAPEVNFDE
jgi:hypothetical protein